MDPKTVSFGIQQAKTKNSCKGCLFDGEHSTVCHAACAEAKLRNLPDCDDINERGKRVIYIEIDPRQLDIEKDVLLLDAAQT
jgi:hypothetical protein